MTLKSGHILPFLVAGALVAAVIAGARRNAPGPVSGGAEAPSILDEIEKLEQSARPYRSGFEMTGALMEPVVRVGNRVTIGTLVLDVSEPLQALERLLRLARGKGMPEDMVNGKTPAANDVLRGVAYLLKSFPECGIPFYEALLADDALGRQLGRHLKLSMSKRLHDVLVSTVAKGDAAGNMVLAARALENKPLAPANRALHVAWQREEDPAVRRACIETLAHNLRMSAMDRGVKAEVLEDLRRSAAEASEPARRVEAVLALIEGQRGYVPPSDRQLIQSCISKETDPARRRELVRLTDGIRSGRERE
jgi:hypothetical protein